MVSLLEEGKSWGRCLVQLCAKYRLVSATSIKSLPLVPKDKRSCFSQGEIVGVGSCPAPVTEWQSTGGSNQRSPGFDSRWLSAFLPKTCKIPLFGWNVGEISFIILRNHLLFLRNMVLDADNVSTDDKCIFPLGQLSVYDCALPASSFVVLTVY